MNSILRIAAILLLVCAVPVAFAQQTGSSTSATAQAGTPTPEEFDKQLAKMQEQMKKMQEQMAKIQQTQDPQERQKLLQDHWATMQNMMTLMHGTWGGMGCCGASDGMMGGHMMMGGPMMWQNYQNLTPEQLKQRQYMMDRWMPMQQMMMNQMMQHQYWMMQLPAPPPSASAPKK
jgi:hypothetical protein